MVASLFSKGQASTIGLKTASNCVYDHAAHDSNKGIGQEVRQKCQPYKSGSSAYFRGYNTGTISDSVYIFCAECIYQKLSKEKACRDQGDISKRNIIVMVEF